MSSKNNKIQNPIQYFTEVLSSNITKYNEIVKNRRYDENKLGELYDKKNRLEQEKNAQEKEKETLEKQHRKHIDILEKQLSALNERFQLISKINQIKTQVEPYEQKKGGLERDVQKIRRIIFAFSSFFLSLFLFREHWEVGIFLSLFFCIFFYWVFGRNIRSHISHYLLFGFVFGLFVLFAGGKWFSLLFSFMGVSICWLCRLFRKAQIKKLEPDRFDEKMKEIKNINNQLETNYKKLINLKLTNKALINRTNDIKDYEAKLLNGKDIPELKKKIDNLENKLENQTKSIESLFSEIQQYKKKVSERNQQYESDLQEMIQSISQCGTSLFSQFPEQLSNQNLFNKKTGSYSNALCLGKLSVSFQNMKLNQKTNEMNLMDLPRLISFPVSSPVLINDKFGKSAVINFILRSFLCVPLEQISISVIDPIGLGNSLDDIKILLNSKHLFPAGRFLTRAQEIQDELDQQLQYVENLIQSVFNSNTSDWDSYNKKNPANPLPYKLLVIFDFPEEFSDKSISYLSKLLKHGPTCGVLPLLFLNFDAIPNEKRFEAFKSDLQKYASKYQTLSSSLISVSQKNVLLHEEPDEPLSSDDFKAILSCISDRLMEIESSAKLPESLDETSLWHGNSSGSISVSVGRNGKDNTDLVLSIGDPPNPAHILLGGQTGSGKSNFLHVLICGLCSEYSPEELQLYLLDYKEGTEFNSYANPVLPHARLIATQSDIEYGLTVLRHLKDEHRNRSELFKKNNVANYKDYRSKTKQNLPRILLIVDEFQKLFESRELAVSSEIETLMNDLLRQGRSSGIHLLLATQTIHGLQNQSRSQLLSNLSGRIALSCTQEDSALILGSSNFAAAELKSPPEAILNTANGAKSANILFEVPLADPNYRQDLLQRLNHTAKENSLVQENTIFYGDILPEIPPIEAFETSCSGSEIQLLLGKGHDFIGAQFVLNLGKDNLLIAGYDKTLRTGLLNSIFMSLKQISPSVEILYMHSADEEFDLLPSARLEGSNHICKDSSWNAEDLNDFITKEGQKIIIIDSYDYAGSFQNRNQSRFGRKPQDPKTPYEILCEIAASLSSIHDIHVLLFVEDYDRFSDSTQAKDLFGRFNLRIGFGMDEDLAGRFVKAGTGYGKFNGIADSKKAVFVNRKTNERCLIRPFILPEGKPDNLFE